LIVDDEPAIRTSLSHLLTEIGYSVRSAQDGFSALVEIWKEIPDIVLSDLNMPGMSGFDLLAVIRRRFPSIQVIAMSGAVCGDASSRIAADAFYQKGCGVGSLLQIMKDLPSPARTSSNPPAASTPIWIQPDGHTSSGEPYVTITCPECSRTFPQALGSRLRQVREIDCVYCLSKIPYAIVQPADFAQVESLHRSRNEAKPRPAIQPNF
jgi:CheY-like chemotaxis protein/DNA-directed RNA polymerase subunit RPC12/RpoP